MSPQPTDPVAPASRARRAVRAAAALAAVAVGLTVPLTASAAHTKLGPPVIHEAFTLLPCPAHPVSTLDLEGCAEHRIVATDHQIDRVARSIFAALFDDAARLRFIAAQSAWLAYRTADCTSMSDQYEHGTLAGVVAAACTADVSKQRLSDLRSFEKLLAG